MNAKWHNVKKMYSRWFLNVAHDKNFLQQKAESISKTNEFEDAAF